MKAQLNLVICTMVSFALLGCQGQQEKGSEVNYPMEFTDDYKKVRVFPQEGQPESYTRYEYYPKKPMAIEGVPCANFTLNSNGKLITYTLSEAYELNGTILPEGTTYQARDWGKEEDTEYILTLPEITTIQGYQVLNKEYKGAQHHLDLYKEGQLKVFVSVEDVEIDRILCKGGKKDCIIILDEDGSLKECTLAKDIEASGKIYKAEERFVR